MHDLLFLLITHDHKLFPKHRLQNRLVDMEKYRVSRICWEGCDRLEHRMVKKPDFSRALSFLPPALLLCQLQSEVICTVIHS